MRTLNLGILAHVDAGKTSLTERLLHAAGVIDALGSVDAGTTQTDSMALERQRGITIRAAVVAFTVDDVAVNLIDTPGHPDFIAEVERSLHVLDGAVLVVSAVEGVQSQTVVVARALHRLRVPTLIFVNKIDRAGADPQRVVTTIRQRLSRHVVAMGSAAGAGRRDASFVPYGRDDERFLAGLVDVLIDRDEALLATMVDDAGGRVAPADLHARLAAQTAAAQVHPMFFGSAATGAGVRNLMGAFTTLLPAAAGDPDGPAAGSVFKVERGRAGEKVAYVRMSSGRLRVRERVRLDAGREETVTGLKVFEGGAAEDRAAVVAGQIATVSGLRQARVGDTIGSPAGGAAGAVFAPPTLETAVVARNPTQKERLYGALRELADQDPLIDLRQDDVRGELFVSLYGEVQREVIEHTLAVEYGVHIEFRETTTICIERPVGTGRAVDRLGDPSNPFLATVGLTVEAGPPGAVPAFRLAVDVGTMPLYVYGRSDAFRDAMARYVGSTLQQGLAGWAVHDCVVALTECAYTSPATGAGDFRKLTPLVVMAALRQAGTVVCEPVHRFHLDAPADTLSAVLRLLTGHRAVPGAPAVSGAWFSVDGDVPAAEVQGLQRQLHGRTRGEGVLEVRFDRYEPTPRAPTRRRTDSNPLDRKEYLRHVLGRA